MRTTALLLLLFGCRPKDDTDGDTDAVDTDTAASTTCADDVPEMLRDVSTLDLGGVAPARLVVTGDGACPLLADASGAVFGAIAHHGAGRWFHVGSEAHVAMAGESGATFAANLARWAGRTERPVVGVDPALAGAVDLLVDLGVDARAATVADLGEIDVFVTSAEVDRDAAARDALVAWVDGGGGLVTGGGPVDWVAETGADAATAAVTAPANLLLAPIGVVATPTAATGGSQTLFAPSPLLHAIRARDALAAHVDGTAPLAEPDQRSAAGALSFAARALPLGDDAWTDALLALYTALPPVNPTVAAPVAVRDAPIDALTVALGAAFGVGLPPDRVFAIPSAFPGPVPAERPRTTIRATIDASWTGIDPDYTRASPDEPVWRATGAYVPPGEVVTVTIPTAWAGAGLSVRIGPFTDALWSRDPWARHPEISRVVPLTAVSTPVASGFGGPLYVRVPAGSALGAGEVVVDGAVAYARYTGDAEAFRAALPDAPLAEIEAPGVAITVPAAVVPADVDVEALAALWGRVLAANADLAAMSPRPRDERFAIDVQITDGLLHAGYPLMGYSYGRTMTNVEKLTNEGDYNAFYALGENHRLAAADLPGTAECTAHLWVVYTMEEVVGRDRADANVQLAPGARAARVQAYLDGGRDFVGRWNGWTCVETWLELQEEFGWGLFRELNAQQLALKTRPTSDQARIDDWVVRTSRIAGKDLTPFYLAWGFPLGDGVAAQVADLPAWEDHPLAGR